VQRSYDVDFWRRRAQGTRVTAEAMTSPIVKRELLAIAEGYERLADHEQRTAAWKARPSRDLGRQRCDESATRSD
jgi:hypothetical protein